MKAPHNAKAPDPIDPIAMARFLVLPGAARLLEAFAAIPPGPLRESVIQHAEVIAMTYASAPADSRMPDPLGQLAAGNAAQLAAPTPDTRTGRKLPPLGKDVESKVVELRLAGVAPSDIARRLNIGHTKVFEFLKKAREAGVPIPKQRRSKLTGDGPVKKTWFTSLDELAPQGMAAVVKAAATRGIEPQEYLERRLRALELAQRGASYETILRETGEKDDKVVSAWLSNARGVGISVPYVTFLQAAPEAAAEPQAAVEPLEFASMRVRRKA